MFLFKNCKTATIEVEINCGGDLANVIHQTKNRWLMSATSITEEYQRNIPHTTTLIPLLPPRLQTAEIQSRMVNLKAVQAHNATLKSLGPGLTGVFGKSSRVIIFIMKAHIRHQWAEPPE